MHISAELDSLTQGLSSRVWFHHLAHQYYVVSRNFNYQSPSHQHHGTTAAVLQKIRLKLRFCLL